MTEQMKSKEALNINPCPHCGDICPRLEWDGDNGGYWIECLECSVRGPKHSLKTKAISLWNMMQVKQYEADPCCCDDCIREVNVLF